MSDEFHERLRRYGETLDADMSAEPARTRATRAPRVRLAVAGLAAVILVAAGVAMAAIGRQHDTQVIAAGQDHQTVDTSVMPTDCDIAVDRATVTLFVPDDRGLPLAQTIASLPQIGKKTNSAAAYRSLCGVFSAASQAAADRAICSGDETDYVRFHANFTFDGNQVDQFQVVTGTCPKIISDRLGTVVLQSTQQSLYHDALSTMSELVGIPTSKFSALFDRIDRIADYVAQLPMSTTKPAPTEAPDFTTTTKAPATTSSGSPGVPDAVKYGVIAGGLASVGGPAPGSTAALSGRIIIVASTNGAFPAFTTVTKSDGAFSVRVPVGTYRVCPTMEPTGECDPSNTHVVKVERDRVIIIHFVQQIR